MFEHEVRVGMGHIGADGLLKLGSAADFLQNASWFQMNTEKQVLEYFKNNGVNMYLVSRQIDVQRLPAYGEKVVLKAWIHGCDQRFGLRNTVMHDAAGKVCMASSATGAFINLAAGRGMKISHEALSLFRPEPAYPMELLPRKIALPKNEPEIFAPIKVCSYHLDFFKHMNNARYVDIASACLPAGFSPRRIRMEYKRAALLGQLIRPVLYTVQPDSREGLRHIVVLSGPEAVCCVIEFSS